ncbi:DUF6765 family protein [Vibrio sp. F74]|uniref:DUF6765 family protein n=1 Tax=Vibrio sp. F74 TaxID=700020 RepID=UPI0035F5AB7D
MQIDGHHTLTYVVARFAGMEHEQAEKLAYCAQYVDEATNSEPVRFSNGAMFNRISSAHKMLDYRNGNELSNHLAWIPFHFLPGNQGKTSESIPEGGFIQRLVCKPDSPVARDMLRAVAKYRQSPFGLHILGIAMHVYADTFAHYGFAGVSHKINEVTEINSNDEGSLLDRVKDSILNWGISSVSPLGHGPALSFPDRPYIKWDYKTGSGDRIVRDNTDDFLKASNQMYKVIRCYLEDDGTMDLDNQNDIPEEKLALIKKALLEFRDDEGEVRHKHWLKWISEGKFGFDAVKLEFIVSGKGSWKEIARGKAVASPLSNDLITYRYSENFLNSDWKHFHDALKSYRLDIIRDVLPKYGICVA